MAAEEILAFLEAIDAELTDHADAGVALDLHLIGRSALILGYGLRLATKDVDIVEVGPSPLLEAALAAFGRGGGSRAAGGFYLESVSSGFPPMPAGFDRRGVAVAGPWRVIRPRRAEAHDLVVSKLRRYHAGDREDVGILCDTGEILAATLVERFESAYAFSDRDDPRVEGAAASLAAVLEYLAGRRRTP